MPDDAAALVARRALRARATFVQTLDGLVNGAELLVARHHLARLAVDLLEDGEVADQVEQVRRTQHARDENLLAL